MRWTGLLLVVLAAVSAWGDQMPPVVNGKGASLKDLVGSDKLVTVVLKGSGATDENLRVVDVGPDYFSVTFPNNERSAYLFSSVQEVRVQDGRVDKKKFTLEESRSLRIEEQRVVDRALERVREFYDNGSADQTVKVQAAMLLALNGNNAAQDYLRRLAGSNDLETELEAALSMYLAGQKDVTTAAVADGLASGSRATKTKAALLAGLLNAQNAIPVLAQMVQDRDAEICGPAARALARLGYRDALPSLFKMVMELNEAKGEAGVYALARLGGPDVIAQVKQLLEEATGQIRLRLVLILHKLDDPVGRKLLADEMMSVGTLAPDAALALARDGDWGARQYLMERMERRYDDSDEPGMIYRTKAAMALIEAGDAAAVSQLQDLLRTEKPELKKRICRLIGEEGRRRLITIMQPVIENADMAVALEACTATMAMARPAFQERLAESRDK